MWENCSLLPSVRQLSKHRQHYHYFKNGGTSFICVKALLQRGARIYTGQRGSELAQVGAKLEPDVIIDEPWNENQLIEFVKYVKNTPGPRQPNKLT